MIPPPPLFSSSSPFPICMQHSTPTLMKFSATDGHGHLQPFTMWKNSFAQCDIEKMVPGTIFHATNVSISEYQNNLSYSVNGEVFFDHPSMPAYDSMIALAAKCDASSSVWFSFHLHVCHLVF